MSQTKRITKSYWDPFCSEAISSFTVLLLAQMQSGTVAAPRVAFCVATETALLYARPVGLPVCCQDRPKKKGIH